MSKYVVRVWRDRVEEDSRYYSTDEVDFEYEYETLKKAREMARYFLTQEFQHSAEASAPWSHSDIMKGKDILEEFDAK